MEYVVTLRVLYDMTGLHRALPPLDRGIGHVVQQ